MKSQVAAEIAAAASLARSGWRPARGELLIVAVVDEETGGALGAQWITADASREGALRHARQRGRRRGLRIRAAGAATASCCAEKGVFRFTVATDGVAGHASMPAMGDNALLKMGPVLERFAARQPSYRADRRAAGVPRGDRRGPWRPARLGRAPARSRRAAGDDVRADARRDVHADAHQGLGEDQRDPRRAELKVDCRVPPGLGEAEVRAGDRRGARRTGRRPAAIEFTEQVAGNRSPIDSPLMDAIGELDRRAGPGARGACPVDAAGLHRLAPFPRRLPRMRRLRLLPPPPSVAAARPRR